MLQPTQKRRSIFSALGVAAMTLVIAGAAGAQNIVLNPSFETGDNSFWNTIVSPNGDFNFATSNTTFNAQGAHSGSFWEAFGCVRELCETNQTLATVAGESYDFSYWYASDGGQPNEMRVSWDGTTLVDHVNDPSFGWTQESFSVVGTGSDVIAFDGRDDPSWQSIDDVSVTANVTGTPEPSSLVMMASGLFGVAGFGVSRRRKAARVAA